MRTINDECLDRLIFFGEASLKRACTEYEAHYNRERSHQSLDNRLIDPEPPDSHPGGGAVVNRTRLGGALSFYREVAA